MEVAYFHSPIGLIELKADENGLWSAQFLERDIPLGSKESTQPVLKQAINELEAYFGGQIMDFNVPLIWKGTYFQRKVWHCLSTIPFGLTISYAALAKKIGNPKSVRAVANANGANPLCIFVPCHRVIQKNGGLGGYSAGTTKKKWLLAHEAKYKLP